MKTVNQPVVAASTLVAAIVLLLASSLASAQAQTLSRWHSLEDSGWEEKSFEGNTVYQARSDDSGSYLSARADSSASALFLKRDIDVSKTPVLSWRWRVQAFNGARDHLQKAEDDFPARLYVVVREGILPWQTLALNYVWADAMLDRESWKNPFTDKAIMVPVARGREGVGEWRSHRVNIVEDFKRYFGKDITRISGIALMTDADNFGGVSAADYGEITISAPDTVTKLLLF